MDERKLQSAALFFTILGAMLLLPPLVLLFNASSHRFLGVPAIVIYLFAVWLGLIAVTAWFARRLPHAPTGSDKPEADG